MGRHRVWSDEQLIKILKHTASALGRTPRRREQRRPDSKVYIDRFGSWAQAVRLAGLSPRRTGHHIMVKRSGSKPLTPLAVVTRSIELREYWAVRDPSLFPRNEVTRPQHPYARRSA